MSRLLIAGGGLAGCLAAMAIARRRPDIELMLVEQAELFGGNHIWSFFDSDVASEHRWVLDGVAACRWPDYDVHFPRRSRTIATGYNSIRSVNLDAAVRQTLRPDQYRLGRRILSVDPGAVTLEGGERLEADAVLDARGPGAMPGIALAWQKFAGRVYRFPQPHGVRRPVIMDAMVEQIDGYRFIYKLPISDTELLVEDTYYSHEPSLDKDALRDRIDQAVSRIGDGQADVIDEESGVLPVVLSGDVDSLWRGEQVARLGLRGGFFHPTTSYSLPDAVANAALLAEQKDFGGAALHSLFRNRAQSLWRERSFFRLLNRMLFHAAEPDQRYRVLEHFYRLSPAVIGRFYSGQLTRLDKLRILSGAPPVPIGRALSALRRTAA